MALTDTLRRLADAQATSLALMGRATIGMLTNLWRPYRRFTDYNLGVAHAARSADIVESAARQARMRQEAQFKIMAQQMHFQYVEPANREPISSGGILIPGGVDVYQRQGTTPLDVYQRPLEDARYAISQGGSTLEGLDALLARLETLSDTDLALARRDQAEQIMRPSGKITGYRRVIHPELAKSHMSCGLCVVASTRIYHKAELMPIHDHCNCDVMPIVGGNDPGNDLNQEDLQAIYDAAGGTGAGDLLKTKVAFTDHGELGPIISSGSRPGKKQREAAKAARDNPLTPYESIQQQLHTLRKSSAALTVRYDNGEDVAQALAWQKNRILNLEAQLKLLDKGQ